MSLWGEMARLEGLHECPLEGRTMESAKANPAVDPGGELAKHDLSTRVSSCSSSHDLASLLTQKDAEIRLLVEQACRFNCDAASSCNCHAHELYRAGQHIRASLTSQAGSIVQEMREKAAEARKWAAECPPWDGANSHELRNRAGVYENCAAKLESLCRTP